MLINGHYLEVQELQFNFLSYEVVSGLSLLAPLMMIGSLSLIDINNYQAGGISNWIIWSQPVAFVLFVIAGFAETNRTPFDLLEHEAELVAGYATEYSGMRWGCFYWRICKPFYNFIFSFIIF